MIGLRSRPQLLAILATLALFVRLLVPAGFMPHVADGQVAIVACPGVMASVPHGHGHDAPKHDGFERPCAFAAIAAVTTIMVIAVLLAVPLARLRLPVARPAATRRARAALRWRPPLRAPPTISSIR